VIAIVDDDEPVRTATAALVRSLGYEARAFASAEAFLGCPGAGACDCLIVDVQMPGMSGPDLQQALLQRPGATPIIFITAFPDAQLREQVLAAGAIGMLGKPCDGEALVTSIKAALEQRQGAAATHL